MVWCSLLLLGLFAAPRNPYGADFFSILLPALLLLVSLQWLLLSSRFGWQIATICTAFLGAITILSSRLPWARENPANYVLLMLIAMVAQIAILWFLVPDKAARSILLAQNLAVALVILSGDKRCDPRLAKTRANHFHMSDRSEQHRILRYGCEAPRHLDVRLCGWVPPRCVRVPNWMGWRTKQVNCAS